MSKNPIVFHLIIALGVALGSLSGCASSEPKLRKVKIRNSPYQHQTNSAHDNETANISDERATEKKDPKIVSQEIERSGDLDLTRGNLHTAFIHYEKSIKLNPDNTRARYKKGLLLIIARMNQEAIEEFQEVLKREPENALAYEGIGQALFQMKKYDEAENNLQKALELEPKLWKAHNYLGIIYDYRKRYDMAIQEYNAAVTLKPDEGLLYNNLGVSYSLSREYEKAINAFNKALKTKYAHGKMYNNLGLVLSKLGRYEEALEAFKKEGDEAQAYNNLGCIYLGKGEYDKAMSSFEKAIEIKLTFYDKASENLRKASISQMHESSLDSAVQSPSNAQTERAAENLQKKQEQQEPASAKPQMQFAMLTPAGPEQIVLEKQVEGSLQGSGDVEASAVQSPPNAQTEQLVDNQQEKQGQGVGVDAKAQIELAMQAPASPVQGVQGEKRAGELQESVQMEGSKTVLSKMDGPSQESSPYAQVETLAIELLQGSDKAQAYTDLGWKHIEQGESEKAMICFEKALEIRHGLSPKATDNSKEAKMSDVQSPPDTRAEEPVAKLGEQPQGQEQAIAKAQVEEEPKQQGEPSGKAQLEPVAETPANPDQVVRELSSAGYLYLEESADETLSKTDSTKTGALSQGDPPYAQVEGPSVQHLDEGKGFRLKFNLVNPNREAPIAGTVAIVVALKNSDMPLFISFPRMELDDGGLPVELNKDLRFHRISRFMPISGEFNFPLSYAQAFRILVYNPGDELVYSHILRLDSVKEL